MSLYSSYIYPRPSVGILRVSSLWIPLARCVTFLLPVLCTSYSSLWIPLARTLEYSRASRLPLHLRSSSLHIPDSLQASWYLSGIWLSTPHTISARVHLHLLHPCRLANSHSLFDTSQAPGPSLSYRIDLHLSCVAVHPVCLL